MADLAKLTEQMRGLADTLLQAANDIGPAQASVPAAVSAGSDRQQPTSASATQRAIDLCRLAERARRTYRFRRARDKLLPASLVGEPAWDMLLDLFIHEVEGAKVSVTSLCIASSAPATTALRYIEMLERNGLISRTRCVTDQRVIFVRLTRRGLDTLGELLDTWG